MSGFGVASYGFAPAGPEDFPCQACGCFECTCPPADEEQYLIWWRAAVESGEIDFDVCDVAHFHLEAA